MRRLARVRAGMVLGLGLAGLASWSSAAVLDGVEFPDTAEVEGVSVKLNGTGLRRVLFVKVYVAALYLQTPTKDGATAVSTDEAKRMVLHMVRDVTHEEMKDAFQEGFEETATPAVEPDVERFKGFFTEPIQAGEQYVFDYAPGKGTRTLIDGKSAGVIEGAAFMKALWGIWLGADPPSSSLKEGLLGG